MPRKYIPKPDPLVDVPPEPTEAELDAIAARRPPPTPVELRSFERSVRVLHLGDFDDVERRLDLACDEFASQRADAAAWANIHLDTNA